MPTAGSVHWSGISPCAQIFTWWWCDTSWSYTPKKVCESHQTPFPSAWSMDGGFWERLLVHNKWDYVLTLTRCLICQLVSGVHLMKCTHHYVLCPQLWWTVIQSKGNTWHYAINRRWCHCIASTRSLSSHTQEGKKGRVHGTAVYWFDTWYTAHRTWYRHMHCM